MVAGGRGSLCGTSAACADSLLSRRARAATAAAAHVRRVMRQDAHDEITAADRGDLRRCGAREGGGDVSHAGPIR